MFILSLEAQDGGHPGQGSNNRGHNLTHTTDNLVKKTLLWVHFFSLREETTVPGGNLGIPGRKYILTNTHTGKRCELNP